MDPVRTTSEEAARAIPDARLAPAFAELADPGVAVLSLDIFDTLLWRRVAEPEDAFVMVANRLRDLGALADGVPAEEFALLRRAAEKEARRRKRERGEGEEVALAEVHRALPRSLFTRDLTEAELAELELEVERSLLVPDLDVLGLVRAAHQAGKEVVAISDTYYSEAQLRLLLARGPLAHERIDHVFCSNAHGTGKAAGLFSVLLERLGRRPEEVLHVGDNHVSDVESPRRLGIRAVYFDRRPAALRRIMELESPYAADRLHTEHGERGLAALRGKVLHRAEGVRQPEGLRPFWDFGAASLGPAFAAFAEWVHHRSSQAGASKVLCLMREGQLLADLVNRAAMPGEPAVQAEPLWLSRQVCARAAIMEASREELETLFERRRLPTLREFVGTVGLSLEDLPDLAPQADRWLDDAGFGDVVIDAIVFDSRLQTKVVSGAQALRRRILRYLEQVRPQGERRLVLVDLGWGATIQALVERLLREAGIDCTTVGLYLLTGERAADRALEGVESHGFLGSFGLPGTEVDAIMRSPEVLEQLCMPDHGSQTDLTEELQPVLEEAPEEFAFQSVQRAAVQQGILAFQREWNRYREAMPEAMGSLWQGTRDLLRAMIVRSVVAPTADEAALFGPWVHDENFGSERVEGIAAGPLAQAVPYLDPRTLVGIPMTRLYWPFGLAALHDEQLARSAAAASTGLLDWEAFASELETGPFELYADLGWGFDESAKLSTPVHRNRRGLSFARFTVRGDFVQRLRLDPTKQPCVLRIDWIRMTCRVHQRTEPVVLELREAGDIASLRLRGCHLIGPKLVMVPGDDPWMVVDLERRAGGRVYEVDVECAFAVLPLARSQARERRSRLKAWVRRLAKESWLGWPLRLARRVARRLAA
jgi:FMN phosphatase YigB (HAD superfamily)